MYIRESLLRNEGGYMRIVIGDIVEENIIVPPSIKCEEVYKIFEETPSLEGIVVCTEEQPIGLVMKTKFFQKLSIKYGHDLFMKRTIDLIMDEDLLVVDESVPILEVSSMAMNRKQENLYDYVIVIRRGRIFGIVSIRDLIVKMSEMQIRIARYSNPLSGLPGNKAIDETLQEMLSYKRFSLFYLDIDSFKIFNDTYGFREGDEVIKETANIISETILTTANEPSFVGHIGGDDFIAVVPHYSHVPICNAIIAQFDHYIQRFYSEDESKSGYVFGVNRKGELEKFPIISLSIAVVQNKECSFKSVEELSKEAARLKRKCKAVMRSVFFNHEALQNDHILQETIQ